MGHGEDDGKRSVHDVVVEQVRKPPEAHPPESVEGGGPSRRGLRDPRDRPIHFIPERGPQALPPALAFPGPPALSSWPRARSYFWAARRVGGSRLKPETRSRGGHLSGQGPGARVWCFWPLITPARKSVRLESLAYSRILLAGVMNLIRRARLQMAVQRSIRRRVREKNEAIHLTVGHHLGFNLNYVLHRLSRGRDSGRVGPPSLEGFFFCQPAPSEHVCGLID